MGLDANYPAVTMNDPNATVTVYNQDHVSIGHLGPSPFQSPSVNVTCRLKSWDDGYWYRLLNPDGWSFPASSAYVSADETHELNPGSPIPFLTVRTSDVVGGQDRSPGWVSSRRLP
jgi:hypothetical protein